MIGEVLKKIRNIFGYKAMELSAMLGISASYLSEIENNKKQPSIELLQKYSEIFKIRPSSLLLLSENLKEDEKGVGADFIRKMMLSLIDVMPVPTKENDG